MADDFEAMLSQADAPRALPPELRDRLSDVLLAAVATAEDPDDAMTAQLSDVDADRPLSPALRDRMHVALSAGARRRPRRVALISTAAGLAAVLAGGTVVTVTSLSGTADRGTVAGDKPGPARPPDTSTPPPNTPALPGKSSGAGAGGKQVRGGVIGGVGAVPAPTAVGDSVVQGYLQNQRLSSLAHKQAKLLVNTDSSVLLTHLSPAFGPLEGGTTIVIRGAGLGNVRDVRFDGVRAPWVDARSGRRLSVVTPVGGTTGPVDMTLRGPGIYIRITHGYTYAYAGVGSWF